MINVAGSANEDAVGTGVITADAYVRYTDASFRLDVHSATVRIRDVNRVVSVNEEAVWAVVNLTVICNSHSS